MNVWSLVLVGLVLSATAYSETHPPEFADRPKKSHDGRFGTRCFQPAGETPAVEQCDVSFLRLVATPEKYHGRRIKTSGYLAEVFGSLILYPSRSSFELGLETEGVEIVDIHLVDQSLKAAAINGRENVLIVGTFDANYLGSNLPRLGAIRDLKHAVARKMPMPKRTNR